MKKISLFFALCSFFFVFAPNLVEASLNRFHSVDYEKRILRSSDPSTIRKGEINARTLHFAQNVYQKAKENQPVSGALMLSRADLFVEKPKTNALSPWFSFHWKNRIRESYRQANEEELLYKKPEITAKRQTTPFRTPYRGAYNYHDGGLTGKQKLMRAIFIQNNNNDGPQASFE